MKMVNLETGQEAYVWRTGKYNSRLQTRGEFALGTLFEKTRLARSKELLLKVGIDYYDPPDTSLKEFISDMQTGREDRWS